MNRHLDNIYRLAHEHAAEQERKKTRRRRAIVGIGTAAAIGLGGVLGHSLLSPEDPGPAPQELHLDGSINMDSVSTRVADELAVGGATVTEDAAGMKVVTLSEYTASPSTKAIGEKADFVKIGTSPAATPDFQQQLDKVVAADAEKLNVIVENESLGSIRFNVVANPNDTAMEGLPNGNMLFTPAKVDDTGRRIPAIIDYTLPAKGNVSMNSMAGMIAHEGTHILQRSIDAIDKLDKEAETDAMEMETYVDTEAYRKDLAEIREVSIKAIEGDSEVVATAKKVIATSSAAHDPAAEARVRIAESVLKGTFNNLQPTTENPSEMYDFNIDEGRVNDPDFVYNLDSGLTTEQIKQATPEQTKAMQEFNTAFDEALYENPESPLSVFDESNYIEGGSRYGHPGANTAELLGSAENIMQSYPQQMVEKAKRLPQKIKQTMVRLLDRVHTDTKRSVLNTGYGYNEAAQQLNEKTDTTLEWVKGEINNS